MIAISINSSDWNIHDTLAGAPGPHQGRGAREDSRSRATSASRHRVVGARQGDHKVESGSGLLHHRRTALWRLYRGSGGSDTGTHRDDSTAGRQLVSDG